MTLKALSKQLGCSLFAMHASTSGHALRTTCCIPVPLLPLERVSAGCCDEAGLRVELAAFRKANAWVEESALFYALTQAPGTANMAWWDWPTALRSRREF